MHVIYIYILNLFIIEYYIDMNRKFPPTRSSSLKISGDVFDNTETRTSISNMDDLEMV